MAHGTTCARKKEDVRRHSLISFMIKLEQHEGMRKWVQVEAHPVLTREVFRVKVCSPQGMHATQPLLHNEYSFIASVPHRPPVMAILAAQHTQTCQTQFISTFAHESTAPTGQKSKGPQRSGGLLGRVVGQRDHSTPCESTAAHRMSEHCSIPPVRAPHHTVCQSTIPPVRAPHRLSEHRSTPSVRAPHRLSEHRSTPSVRTPHRLSEHRSTACQCKGLANS
eukprot:1159442-Pelagomonas_calceolata.AAC.6